MPGAGMAVDVEAAAVPSDGSALDEGLIVNVAGKRCRITRGGECGKDEQNGEDSSHENLSGDCGAVQQGRQWDQEYSRFPIT